MKTPKQVETIEFARAHVQAEIDRIGSLCSTLARIMKGYEPLLGDAGPGNTHRDNIEIRAYAEFVAEQVRVVLYGPMLTDSDRSKWREHLLEMYFNDPEIIAWKDLLKGIV
jgi:hypothetical protein